MWPIDRTLSGATIPGQNRSGGDGNEGVLCIPQTSNITGASPSDSLVLYPGHSLGESYPSAVIQLVYSTALCNKQIGWFCLISFFNSISTSVGYLMPKTSL